MTSETPLVRDLARTLAQHATIHIHEGTWYCGGCLTRLGVVALDPIDDTPTGSPGDLLANHQARQAVETITSHTTRKET